MSKLIPLHGKHGNGKFAIVDNEDFERLSQYKWLLTHLGYAYRSSFANGKQTQFWMHREILNAQKGFDVDHVNRDRVDNRKANIRIATRSQNKCNAVGCKDGSSQYKGVGWHKATKKWRATLMINYKGMYLGIYSTEVEAAKAYDKAAKKHHGEFARLNFPHK